MPSDDLILNVRQIAGYPFAPTSIPSDTIVIQRGGLGGPYVSMNPDDFVGTALASGGDMAIGGQLRVADVQGASGQFSNLSVGLLSAEMACFTNAAIGGVPIATRNNVVTSVNGREGDIFLNVYDVAGAAPIYNPVFTGCPLAPTPFPGACNFQIATTAFVHGAIVQYIDGCLSTHPFVFTFNGRTGNIVLTEQDIIDAGGSSPFDNTALTGIPTAPTAPPLTNNTQIATTAYVDSAVAGIDLSAYAPLASPAFSGYVTAPTAPAGTNNGQVATTAFVTNAIVAATTGVASFNGRTGAVILTGADITGAGGALLASPALTGVPTAPTASPGTNTTQLATTAFVAAALSGGANVVSFNGRGGAVTLTTADITGAGGAPVVSPALTGTPSAPTAAPGTNTTQLATTAFVVAAVAASTTGVSSFNGRTGAVTLATNDISAAGGAVLASPAFTGAPTAPTAPVGTATTQLATTAFVLAAIQSSGVSSFNGRNGAVTLSGADITGAGGALLAGPAFSGIPTAPTAAAGTATTQLATTAFVAAAVAGVPLWNYLPLSGGTLTGNLALSGGSGINATGNITTSLGLVGGTFQVNYGTVRANPGADAWIAFQDASGAQQGLVGFNHSFGEIDISNNTAELRLSGGTFVSSFTFNQKAGGGPWDASSDARIKTVLGAYDLGLDQLMQIKPVRYVYKGNDAAPGEQAPSPDKREFVGLVAQDVERIFPNMVTRQEGWIDGKKVGDLRTLNNGELVYALVNAVLTLAKRLAALEAA